MHLASAEYKKIKVTHVLDSLGVGGLEKGVLTLVNNCTPEFEHSVILMRNVRNPSTPITANTQVVNLGKKPGNSPKFIFRLAKEIRRIAPDIVHTRNWAGTDAIIASILAGVPRIVHGEHGYNIDDVDGSSKRKLFIRKILSPFVSEYICVSDQIKTWLANQIGARRIFHRIYNGVNTEEFTPEGDTKYLHEVLKLPQNIPLIGIVARLDPIKNHRLLIEAFERSVKDVSVARLIIVGAGPELEKLRHLSSDRVIFIGERSDISRLMRCFDIFVLPSYNEGISNTILEAMASGVPVVASRVGGNPELIKHQITGLLFESGHLDGLCLAMLELLQNEQLRLTYGKASRQYVCENHTVEGMIYSYEHVWRNLARSRS